MAQLATLRIQHPEDAGDYIIINQADFDAAVHTPWTAAPDKGKSQPEAEKKAEAKAKAEAKPKTTDK